MNRTDMAGGRQRIDSLQGLRAAAFLGIFTSHCGISDWGAWGVSVFFVLSGFLMMVSYCDAGLEVSLKKNLRFAAGRIKKLYPLHILTMIAALILEVNDFIDVAGPAAQNVIGACNLLIRIVLNSLLIQTWMPFSGFYCTLNWVAWYLSVCAFLYFIFPVIQNCLKRIGDAKKIIAFAAAAYIIQIAVAYAGSVAVIPSLQYENFPKWLTYICPAFRAGDFIIGCCFGYLFKMGSQKGKNVTVMSALEIAAAVLTVLAGRIYLNQSGMLGRECFRYSVLFLPVSMLTVYVVACNRGIVSRLLSCRPLVYLGNISGYTFLIHQIVIRYFYVVMYMLLGRPVLMNRWIMAAVLLAVTVALAEIWKHLQMKLKPLH